MSKPLLQRNTNILLVWLPIILLLSSGVFYYILKKHTHHAEEKYLLLKQQNVWNGFITTSGAIEKHIAGEYKIEESSATNRTILNSTRDTTIFYAAEGKKLPFKFLARQYQWNSRPYIVTTYISSTETNHLIIKVFISEAIILLILLITIVVLNRKSSVWLWHPFLLSINATEKFDIIRNNNLQLSEKTGTIEFDQLNNTINKLVKNVKRAYNSQKQFVENASHEIQTPLAIIRAKLELLINQPNIQEKEASLLGDIANATNRLSEMNKTLLLLAKIENNQFPEIANVSINNVINEITRDCIEYIDSCPLITSNIENEITVAANLSLIEILINNLVNNAIVHNNDKKKIIITIEGSKLEIKNTGDPLLVNPETLFERFRKSTYQKQTTGLGLALIKQICQLYGYNIEYSYKNNWHTVQIYF
ncbi:sensor histidine kinase [Flavobacterium sp. FlaQc-30]|uniref:sensor histidine kinase n=1 Tax=Flavobacterium sp. FlaQc-30 TaxID=3374179 RepID=UPI0037579E33